MFSFLLISPFVSSATWSFFPEEYNVHLCQPADQSGWSSQASNKWISMDRFSPDWTFVWDTFFFSPSNAFSLLWNDNAAIFSPPFFFLMSSHKHPELPYCFQRGDSVSSFETSYNKQKTNYGLSGITVEYEDKRDMMQCSFYNWFRSTVHSIMVYRKPITTNCSSKHEHLARNDSVSFTLYHVSRNAACFMLQPCNEFTAQRPSLL